ncbi:alcohol dehydrogenase [Rhodanobacter sp. FW510-R12]|uniref:cytochrome c n=1 Tax=unclassified Rhodanobacter TaxID=2621553 RepID=UPI0007AA17D6|nr:MULTISPECIES: cytochrome c [unclassified Rhodanobacter]KZC16029.1 alcohol dehydrogenase [Rhodanobacter sp. FW104-R8]KZC26537.1 alcohol dehydrogenase [Rhodanobacter sp. FW510-T8]KZC30395.1 alcohol dehydrogenase [Rhodanobacter sp. FW510-R10]
MTWLRRLLLLVAVLAVLVLGWRLFGSGDGRPTPPGASKVAADTLRDPALIAKGEYLATVGDCAGCHTAQGGARLAGGRSLATPFGNIPVPNITPDRETGLGNWSFEDFWQALHSGKGRRGELLYPAFSYTSYTKVSRDDALAIFAWLQSLAPVHRPAAAPALAFPYSVRKSLAAWRTLYFKEGEFKPDPAQSAEWNRGAYLVQGLGHCNECHAARDTLGGTPPDVHLTGGQIPMQNWYAPDLSTRSNGGLQGWSAQDIVDLLKTGQSARGAAFGPMAAVVSGSTQHMTDADLHAIASYLLSLPPRAPAAEPGLPFDTRTLTEQGGKVYAQHCAACHGKSGKGVAGVYPPLDGNSSVTEPTGINATRMVLLGGFTPVTAANQRPYSMPPFAQQLNDGEVAAVVTYIRRTWSNQAPIVRAEGVSKYRHTPVE